MKKRILAILLVVCMIAALVPTAFATGYSDVDGHWAEDAIARWSAYGIVEGNNGKFEPGEELTRGQLAAIIARLLKLPAAESAGFKDTDGHWAEDVINRCAAAGIMLGDGVNARPGDAVSREETMVLLARALGIKPVENVDMSDYKDAKKVSSWAEGYVAAMTDKGIVNGIDGSLQPASDINRASAMTILHNAISAYANQDGQVVSGTGDGIVLVAAKNVTVTGEADGIVVSAGAEGGTTNITAAKAESVTVQAADADVNINSSEVKDVAVEAPQAEVTLTNTKTENVEVSEKAEDAKVEVGTGSTVTNVENKADGTTVSGSGTVSNVTTSGDNTKVETSGTKVEAAPGTTGTTAGNQTVVGGGTATTTPTTPAPSVHYHSYTYKANGDGTHTGTCACKVTETTACEDGSDDDSKCDKCGDDTAAYVATVGGKDYKTLAEAIAKAKDGDTVTVLSNIEFTKDNAFVDGKWLDGIKYTGDQSFTIDLNGKTLSCSDDINDYLFYFSNLGTKANEITLLNGTLEGGKNLWAVITIGSGAAKYPTTLNLGKGLTVNGDGSGNNGEDHVVKSRNGSIVNVLSGATVISENAMYGVAGGVSSDDESSIANIYDGATITMKDSNGIAVSGTSAVNVFGGTITSEGWAVYTMTSGTPIIRISGGTITGKTGAVAAAASYPTADPKVLISGGTINGTISELLFGTPSGDNKPEVEITGGTFDKDPSAYVAPGCIATEEDVYYTVTDARVKIGTAAELKAFAEDVNKGTSYADKVVVLTANITLPDEEWAPIGTEANPFVGTFDGMGYTISGLKATKDNRAYADDDDMVFGLFGFTGDGDVTIKNLKLTNVNINLANGKQVGAVIGYAQAVTDNVTLSNIEVSGSVTAKQHGAGLVGKIYATGEVTIDKCVNNAAVTTAGNYAAGVVAYISGASKTTITNCVNNGAIVNNVADKKGVSYFAVINTSSSMPVIFEGNTNNADCGNNPDHTYGTPEAYNYMPGMVALSAYQSNAANSASTYKNNVDNGSIYKEGDVKVKGYLSIPVGSTVTLSDANAKYLGIWCGGTVNISDGIFVAETPLGACIMPGTVNISGGTFEDDAFYGVFTPVSGTISGGKFAEVDFRNSDTYKIASGYTLSAEKVDGYYVVTAE